MQALLSKSGEHDGLASSQVLEDIRRAMLDELTINSRQHYGAVQIRVADATDIQDLWYLRGDLMAAIAASDGEAAAKRKITHISNMFRGYLPRGLSSRPSPLGD